MSFSNTLLSVVARSESVYRPRDGYWLFTQVLHAACFPTGKSPEGYTPAEREDAPLSCSACGELIRYESDYLQVRRDGAGTIYTMLDDTTERAWTRTAAGWEASHAEVNIDETQTCPISEVPTALRRAIAELYAGLHEYLPQQLLRCSSVGTGEELKRHAEHEVVCVIYAAGVNVAIECETCSEVLVDYDDDAGDVEEGYDKLAPHVGHALEIVDYRNRTLVECMACGETLLEVKG